MSKVDVIILAGAPAGREMNPDDEHLSRAMIPLGDKTMLQWVVDALKGAKSVGRVFAVGDVSADGLDGVVAPGENLIGNLKAGVAQLNPNEPVLVVCADIPLVKPEAIEDFIEQAVKFDAGLVYPILRMSDCARLYPELKRTALKTGDGVFTGGNIMLLSPDFIARNLDTIDRAFAARKHIAQLARMIGVGILLRVLIGQVFPWAISLSALESAASRMLGAKAKAVISNYPEIGEDVDKPSDLAVVKDILLKS